MAYSSYHNTGTQLCVALQASARPAIQSHCNIPYSTRDPSLGYDCPTFAGVLQPSPLYSLHKAGQLAMGDVQRHRPMQALINQAVPHVTVRHVEPLPAVHTNRLYDVHISDGTSLHLSLPASPMVKLLRSEQDSLNAEAAILGWLAALSSVERPLLQEKTPEPEEFQRATTSQDLLTSDATKKTNAKNLAKFLPKLLAHSSIPHDRSIEYNILKPVGGTPISRLQPPLSSIERADVDYQLGWFCQRLCQIISPTGRFGPALAVVPSLSSPSSSPSPSSRRRDANARMIESRGVGSWSEAFHCMLEAVLRDGEDMSVMLPYGTVRKHLGRLVRVLDGVVTPRLVAIDVGDDLNTLVSRVDCGVSKATAATREPSKNKGTKRPTATNDQTKTPATEDESFPGPAPAVTMTGMKDWSNFVFGDPLFAKVISQSPNTEFLRGFNKAPGRPVQEDKADVKATSEGDLDPDLIDDSENQQTRMLLYDCYHAITIIVKEFYRPQRDSSQRELPARKKLTGIIQELEALDAERIVVSRNRITPPPMRRRLSGEASPAKRARSEDIEVKVVASETSRA